MDVKENIALKLSEELKKPKREYIYDMGNRSYKNTYLKQNIWFEIEKSIGIGHIKPHSNDFLIPKDLFTSITCFLTFNLFAMLGSLATSWIQWPKANLLCLPVLLRAVFLPLFLFCNYLPKSTTRSLPVLITNEWIYWLIAITMSFSSGYLSSLGMMYAPQTVLPKYQITAGMFAAAMLITGIFSGILFSFIFPTLVSI